MKFSKNLTSVFSDHMGSEEKKVGVRGRPPPPGEKSMFLGEQWSLESKN